MVRYLPLALGMRDCQKWTSIQDLFLKLRQYCFFTIMDVEESAIMYLKMNA